MSAEQTYIVWIVFGIIVVLSGIIVFMYHQKRTGHKDAPDATAKKEQISPPEQKEDLPLSQDIKQEPLVAFSDLAVLPLTDARRLVEIRDPKLLERIDLAIPGTIQAVANTGAVHAYNQAIQSSGQMY